MNQRLKRLLERRSIREACLLERTRIATAPYLLMDIAHRGRGGSMVHFVMQYSQVLVAPDHNEYVARVYAATHSEGHWDGWFVFFPLRGGREVATDRETTQNSLGAVSYWASGISTTYLEGALQRGRALLPEARLARRQRAQVRGRSDRSERTARAASCVQAPGIGHPKEAVLTLFSRAAAFRLHQICEGPLSNPTDWIRTYSELGAFRVLRQPGNSTTSPAKPLLGDSGWRRTDAAVRSRA